MNSIKVRFTDKVIVGFFEVVINREILASGLFLVMIIIIKHSWCR